MCLFGLGWFYISFLWCLVFGFLALARVLFLLGLDEFKHHLDDLMSVYRIENERVIHTSQKASTAIVNAIQIMSLPDDRLSEQYAKQLNQYAEQVKRFGSRDQKQHFIKALRSQSERNPNFFLPILDDIQIQAAQAEMIEAM